MQSWLKKNIKISRDGILFFVGLLGILHEVFLTSLDRPDVLILFTAMIGLPVFLRSDEHSKEQKKDDDDPDPVRIRPKKSNIPREQEYDDLDNWQ